MSATPFPEKKYEQETDVLTRESMENMSFNVNPQVKTYKNPNEKAHSIYRGLSFIENRKFNWPIKMALSTPSSVCAGFCMVNQRYFTGTNFATQDYMGMCGDKESIQVVSQAMRKLGVHSGGVPGRMGYNEQTEELIQTFEWYFDEVFGEGRSYDEIGRIRRSSDGENDRVQKCHAQVYSAGWLAGYGAIQGLVQPSDYIVMDALGHNCLKEGAKSSMAKLVLTRHLDIDHLEKKVRKIREKDQKNSILIATESLFSMDSDCPDLDRIQQIAKKYNAILLVDSAHDMFCTGANGRGIISDKIKDFSNVVVIGSGSKSLSSNVGYIVTGNKKLMDLLHISSHAWGFSDALPPAVAALVSHNLKVMASERGQIKRQSLRDNSQYFHDRLHEAGFKTIGFPSPIVIIYIGPEVLSRAIANMMYFEGVVVNSVEFPAVAPGRSRMRVQLQSGHTQDQIDHFVDRLIAVVPQAKKYIESDPSAQLTGKIIGEQIDEVLNTKAKL